MWRKNQDVSFRKPCEKQSIPLAVLLLSLIFTCLVWRQSVEKYGVALEGVAISALFCLLAWLLVHGRRALSRAWGYRYGTRQACRYRDVRGQTFLLPAGLMGPQNA
ncbi:MAG: hypothetical protein K2P57_06790 [Burkholderiales bacterium]|nr:hypothetical protein [Burkholderiales bacterium]